MRFFRMPKRLNAAALLLPALVMTINSGCGKKSEQKTQVQAPSPAVVVAEVTQQTVPIYSEFVAQTRADATVELRARVEVLPSTRHRPTLRQMMHAVSARERALPQR